MILITLGLIALTGIAIYWLRLRAALQAAPRLVPGTVSESAASISVIIPAYNEADNIVECLQALLGSTSLSAEVLEVWVVDDQSTDDTLEIAQGLQAELKDPRLNILPGQPRPPGQTWMGKNWACAQAVPQAQGEFLLFMDADVRLQPGAIEAALAEAEQEQTDLLSCAPVVRCGCLAEWLVQPIAVTVLSLAASFSQVNDPTTEAAFAVGPFMLFRRAAYEQIGGHQRVADQVVEDVELARCIKHQGLNLRYVLGLDLIAVSMYSSWSALWEGWTKNFYLGSRRNLPAMAYLALSLMIIYPLPWVCLLVALATQNAWAVGLGILAIGGHYGLRRWEAKQLQIPTRYWWLSGIGGTLMAVIVLASVIKTETGWGWTWRGRALKAP